MKPFRRNELEQALEQALVSSAGAV
jgi:hypothetical protein